EAESAAQSTPGAGGTALGRRDLEAAAAVRRQKGDPEKMRFGSGGQRGVESELTGQQGYWSDEPAANAPAAPSADTSFAAAANAGHIAAQLTKKRNAKLVDAGSAFVPKLDEFLKLRRMVRGNGWTGIRNDQERLELANELLGLAYHHNDEVSLSVMEELVPE